MPNIRMPDGTIMANVPEGTPKAAILAAWNKAKAAKAVKSPEEDKPDNSLGHIAKEVAMAPIGAAEVAEQGVGSMGKLAAEGLAGPVGGAVSAAQGQGFMPGYNKVAGAIDRTVDPIIAPRTDVGKDMSKVAALPGKAIDYAADKAFDITGSPAVGAGVKTAGNLGEMLLGGKAAGRVGDIIDSARSSVKSLPEGMTKMQAGTLRNSQAAGYKVPPSRVAGNRVSAAMEGAAGKAEVAHMITYKNAVTTQKLGAQALGLPKGAEVSPATIAAAKAQAGKLMEPIAQLPALKVTAGFKREIGKLGADLEETAKAHPDLVNLDQIRTIQQSLLGQPTMTGKVAQDLTRVLRQGARSKLDTPQGTTPSPEVVSVAKAEMKAADAIEKMVDTNLRATKSGVLYKDWLQGRKQYAIASDIEASMNPATGTLDPAKLAKLDEGRKMTGPLRTIVDFHKAFPDVSRALERSRPPTGLTGSDAMLGTVGGIAAHDLGGVALGAARPLMRHALVSDALQKRLVPKP